MSVEVRLKENIKVKSFPKLMISGEIIVFFIKEKYGIILYTKEDYELGDYSETWDMLCFKDYEGEITLRNK
jgi:hypothetical protein